MNKFTTIKTVLIVLIVGTNLYSFLEGMIYGSFWGIACALGSIAALVYCLQLIKKLEKLNEEQE